MPRNNEIAGQAVALTEGHSGKHANPEWEYMEGMWVRIEWVPGPRTRSWSEFLAGLADGSLVSEPSSGTSGRAVSEGFDHDGIAARKRQRYSVPGNGDLPRNG